MYPSTVPPIVTRTLAADHITPVRAYAALRSHARERSSFLLESATPGKRWGRFSVIGYRARAEALYPPGGDALSAIGERLSSIETSEGLAEQFSQAFVGYLAYDAVHVLLGTQPWPNEAAVARFMRDATVVVFDHWKQTLTIAGPSNGAVNRCEWEMTHGPELEPQKMPDIDAVPHFLEESIDDATYTTKVLLAKQMLESGRASQMVLARSYSAPQRNADPFDVYRALRALTPSPYLYFLEFAEMALAEGLAIAGASPQSMLRLHDGVLMLRPMGGMHPRESNEVEERKLAESLLDNPSRRAELETLLEVARDDMGRVCDEESIEFAREVTVEDHSHGMHLAGEMAGRPRSGATSIDVVRAVFPAGAATGSPKRAAATLIRDLEVGPRGLYGGAIGYMTPGGDVELALAVRTVVLRGGEFQVGTGAVIRPGGDGATEVEESRLDARAALAAIRSAQDAEEAREAKKQAKREKELAEEQQKQAQAQAQAEEKSSS